MKEIDAFVEVARRYCKFIDEASSLSLSARAKRAFEILAELVHAATRLPEGGGESPEVEGEVAAPANWPGFGEVDSYWQSMPFAR